MAFVQQLIGCDWSVYEAFSYKGRTGTLSAHAKLMVYTVHNNYFAISDITIILHLRYLSETNALVR